MSPWGRSGAGLHNSWGWGKTALWKDKVSLGTWRAEEIESQGNTQLLLQRKLPDCDIQRLCKATLLSLSALADFAPMYKNIQTVKSTNS